MGRRVALLALLALLAWLGWEAVTWPDVEALAKVAPTTTAFIERFKARERSAGRTPQVALAWTPYAAISPSMKRAVLVAEDVNFFSHHGFDWGQIKRAIDEGRGERETARGASTITQQLVKNLWLTPGRNPVRKAKEAILTWQVERALPKRRILELYLNVVEFGPGVYGVGRAAETYFAKRPADLGYEESALLAAALPRPRSWHPGSRSPAYRRYAASIRSRMDRAEFLGRQL
jgi:monofunctional biosynthetic peptidoglycan transglycosylase